MEKKCKTCGQKVAGGGHLCVPVTRSESTCDWCGSLIMDERHMCSKKLKKVSYICQSCGRLAVSFEHLCKPKKVA